MLVSLCSLAFPAAGWAHATLVRVVPEDGSVLAAAPRAVRVVFDDDVRPRSGIKAIRNGGGSVLGGKPRVVGGRALVVPLRRALQNGDYTVLWRVLSDDGHTLAGVIAFGVGAGRRRPTAALAVDNGPSAQDVVSRWLFFAGLLTAVGAAFFRFAVGPVPLRVHARLVPARLPRRAPGVVPRRLALDAVRNGDGGRGRASPRHWVRCFAAIAPLYPTLERLAVRSRASRCCRCRRSPGTRSIADGRRSRLSSTSLHVAAASFWLGGLVALVLALREAAGDVRRCVRRFSNIASCPLSCSLRPA